ncbi:hypothetical protein SCLCIDRAFT_249081 [Scleroderma citrinum Foug A]|uniref:Uncharacterized protein n=1 Tax=Scleroderma citrinum Foug A TaxID=1036808 RepID=A0A0C3DIU2_9AGAM|nr:hypothetical protein SCLCIDRAFT_249081 [Scleroderma citrinum Foug A]
MGTKFTTKLNQTGTHWSTLDRLHPADRLLVEQACQTVGSISAALGRLPRSPQVAMHLSLTSNLEVDRHFYLKVTSTLPCGNTSFEPAKAPVRGLNRCPSRAM